jgi:hypothetical protein
VDGTLLEAWASLKSFKRVGGPALHGGHRHHSRRCFTFSSKPWKAACRHSRQNTRCRLRRAGRRRRARTVWRAPCKRSRPKNHPSLSGPSRRSTFEVYVGQPVTRGHRQDWLGRIGLFSPLRCSGAVPARSWATILSSRRAWPAPLIEHILGVGDPAGPPGRNASKEAVSCRCAICSH